MCERTSRYNVLLNGQKVGQLYYNMTGYCGALPLPDGKNVSIGERGVAAFKKEAARINRMAKTVGCGKYTHVSGTNGGTMPCGGELTDLSGKVTREFCAECDVRMASY